MVRNVFVLGLIVLFVGCSSDVFAGGKFNSLEKKVFTRSAWEAKEAENRKLFEAKKAARAQRIASAMSWQDRRNASKIRFEEAKAAKLVRIANRLSKEERAALSIKLREEKLSKRAVRHSQKFN